MKYFLVDDYGNHITDDTETKRISIRHADGTYIITGLGNDCDSPFTESRKYLDEMIRLANKAANAENLERMMNGYDSSKSKF